jgi:hypothetical protein
MTLDEVILRALEGGQPVTVNDVTTRFMVNVRNRVRTRLEKLRVRGVVVQEGEAAAIVSSRTDCYVPTALRRRLARRAAALGVLQSDQRPNAA